jgi:hypothetical protein
MQITELNNLSKTYNLKPDEIICIILNLAINNKTISFLQTIGKNSKSKNPHILANQFFNKHHVKQFTEDHKNSFIQIYGEEDKPQNPDNGKRQNHQTPQTSINTRETAIFNDTENSGNIGKVQPGITSENIKEMLEMEFNRTRDPEKRTILLIKIAEFIGLRNTDETDPLKPVIYLPNRTEPAEKQTPTP